VRLVSMWVRVASTADGATYSATSGTSGCTRTAISNPFRRVAHDPECSASGSVDDGVGSDHGAVLKATWIDERLMVSVVGPRIRISESLFRA
jgi:hypothetical protein